MSYLGASDTIYSDGIESLISEILQYKTWILASWCKRTWTVRFTPVEYKAHQIRCEFFTENLFQCEDKTYQNTLLIKRNKRRLSCTIDVEYIYIGGMDSLTIKVFSLTFTTISITFCTVDGQTHLSDDQLLFFQKYLS